MATTKYDPDITPQLAKWMRRSGRTDKQIAEELGIARCTLSLWKKEHKEFAAALRESGNFIDSLVEDSLLKRALGYEVIEEEFERLPGLRQVRVKKKRKHIPPDVTAQIFWLKNRQLARWRDKQEHELTGKDGGPIRTAQVADEDLSGLTTEELLEMQAIHERANARRDSEGARES